MLTFTPELLDDPMFQASEFRARGHTWETTAEKMNVSVRDLRRLVFSDMPRWKQLEREAERNYLRETGLDAINRTRLQMQSVTASVSLAASGNLLRFHATTLRHRNKGRRATAPSGDPMETFNWDDITEEECYSSSLAVVRNVEAKMTPEEIRKAHERDQWQKDHPIDPDAWKKDLHKPFLPFGKTDGGDNEEGFTGDDDRPPRDDPPPMPIPMPSMNSSKRRPRRKSKKSATPEETPPPGPLPEAARVSTAFNPLRFGEGVCEADRVGCRNR